VEQLAVIVTVANSFVTTVVRMIFFVFASRNKLITV
jgi:hypothetical protein